MNVSDYFLSENNYFLPQKLATLPFQDYYALQPSEKALASSINSQSETSQTISGGATYASPILSAGSTLFAQGMMLTEMIYLLKFVEIKYPSIVTDMFNAQNKPPTLIFHYIFENDARDLAVLPKLHQKYKVSVYFLNNMGESLCQMLAILLISCVFLLITPYEAVEKPSCFQKTLMFFRNYFVWEFSLIFLVMNLQKLVFYFCCSWMFPPVNTFNAKLNLSAASFVGLLIILWILHLKKKIQLCQQLKAENIQENSLFSPEISSMRNQQMEETLNNNSVIPSLVNTPNRNTLYQTSTKTYKKSALEVESLKKSQVFPVQNNDISSFEITSSKSEKNTQDIKASHNIFLKKLGKFFSFAWIYSFLYKPRKNTVFLQRYEFLHLDFKADSVVTVYYALIYYLRQCLMSIFTAFLYNYPLAQILVLNAVNLMFLLYTVFSNAFTSKFSYVVCCVNEIIGQIAFSSALVIAFYDYNNNFDYNDRMKLGWTIIWCNLILLYWVLTSGVTKPIFLAIHQKWQKKRALNKIHAEKGETP